MIVLAFPTLVIVTDEVSGTAVYVVLLAALGCGLVLPVLAHLYADWRVRQEWAWARSLPYELDGYPGLLGVKPGKNWTHLEVSLRFADGEPDDLAEILRGFDPELERAERWFVRDRPAEIGKILPFDLNRRVRWWVRRFVSEVLAPLHTAHRLRFVELRLVACDD